MSGLSIVPKPQDFHTTTILLGGGPSLTPAQVGYCRGRARVVAINNAYQIAPFADHLHGADLSWWLAHPDAVEFGGTKTVTRAATFTSFWDASGGDWLRRHGVEVLRATGEDGFDPRRGCVRTGLNGGYQMVHREAQLGARRIVLLGFDMRPGHWHEPHRHSDPAPSDYAAMREHFRALKPILDGLGVQVVNCTPASELICFAAARLEQSL